MTKAQLTQKAREARNRYYREWRKRNKDKVKESNKRYWERKAKKEGEVKELETVSDN